jgi:hypothetical protein
VELWEKATEPAIALQSVLSSLEQKLGVQKCFDLAGRIIPKITDSALISKFDSILCDYIIQVLSSNEALKSIKSNERKAAFDLAYTLLQLRDQDWQMHFYQKVREEAGAPRENIIRGMMVNRLGSK